MTTPYAIWAEAPAIADATAVGSDLFLMKDASAGLVKTITGTQLAVVTGGGATAAEVGRVADVSARIVNAITTLPIVEATHEGKIITLNLASGFTITLPAATGGGAKYTFLVGTTITSNDYVFAVTGDDTICGFALAKDGDGEPANGWSTESATAVTLGGTSNATGGVKGDRIEFVDMAADLWHCSVWGTNGGTEATPFS